MAVPRGKRDQGLAEGKGGQIYGDGNMTLPSGHRMQYTGDVS